VETIEETLVDFNSLKHCSYCAYCLLPNAWGYNWATLFLRGNKYRNMTLQVGGVSKIE
jgi:hypothetical protein